MEDKKKWRTTANRAWRRTVSGLLAVGAIAGFIFPFFLTDHPQFDLFKPVFAHTDACGSIESSMSSTLGSDLEAAISGSDLNISQHWEDGDLISYVLYHVHNPISYSLMVMEDGGITYDGSNVLSSQRAGTVNIYRLQRVTSRNTVWFNGTGEWNNLHTITGNHDIIAEAHLHTSVACTETIQNMYWNGTSLQETEPVAAPANDVDSSGECSDDQWENRQRCEHEGETWTQYPENITVEDGECSGENVRGGAANMNNRARCEAAGGTWTDNNATPNCSFTSFGSCIQNLTTNINSIITTAGNILTSVTGIAGDLTDFVTDFDSPRSLTTSCEDMNLFNMPFTILPCLLIPQDGAAFGTALRAFNASLQLKLGVLAEPILYITDMATKLGEMDNCSVDNFTKQTDSSFLGLGGQVKLISSSSGQCDLHVLFPNERGHEAVGDVLAQGFKFPMGTLKASIGATTWTVIQTGILSAAILLVMYNIIERLLE